MNEGESGREGIKKRRKGIMRMRKERRSGRRKEGAKKREGRREG